jgi:hypothetical protein
VKQLGANAVDTFGRMRGIEFSDPKGGKLEEWPHDLQVQEIPERRCA